MAKKVRKRKPMAKHDERLRDSHRGGERPEGMREEPIDDPEEHREIENLRFHGGLPPTPELYARARRQWYRLPGSIVRPSMDSVIDDPADGENEPSGSDQSGRKGDER